MSAIAAPSISPTQTPTRAEQARINGSKSRGPTTEEGKAKSSQNARKHGLTAKHSLVDPEHASEYLQYRSSMIADLKPQDAVEEMLSDQVVKSAWKLRQAHNIEMDLMRENLEAGDTLHSAFTEQELTMIRLSRYQTAIERSMYRALNELRKRQAETQKRKNFETNPAGASLEAIRAEMKRRDPTGSATPPSPTPVNTEEPVADEPQPPDFKTNPDLESKPPQTDPAAGTPAAAKNRRDPAQSAA